MNLKILSRTDITDCGGEPYLTRWHLLRYGDRFSLMLHKFHRSDEDRELHDHPFDFVSLILTGGYYEWREMTREEKLEELDKIPALRHGNPASLQRRVWYPRFSVLFRRAEWRHRIQIKKAPVWTLVLRLGHRREWGFWSNDGKFTHWKNWWRQHCS